MLDEFLVHLFFQGQCLEAHKIFGAHFIEIEGIKGVQFTVFAPNANSVSVVGDFNRWDETKHLMVKVHEGGIWQLFIPTVKHKQLYKYCITTKDNKIIYKSDPYAYFSEIRPKTASRTYRMPKFKWRDKKWLNNRNKNFEKPLNIYEMHFGSWQMEQEFSEDQDGIFYSYADLSKKIIPYVKSNGYTHIELMPLLEHPFDGSWGYQSTGYFSATSRYGEPKELMQFIDECHQENIGVIMDFVPVHFVNDAHGLSEFDGGCVYEYPDLNRRYSEWGTSYFDVGNDCVRSFLMSSVYFWIDYFHIDGIRFDAVSHLIFWQGNKSLGQNDGGIELMQRMNSKVNEVSQGVMLIAEDSTDYPKVTRDRVENGLGFDYKWDLGWMNDTLKYMALDPIYRQYNHHLLTFSMAYFYNENFILPFSHDEVVHGKKTIIDKIFGSYEQKFAQLKVLYMYMMTHPGKKLNFMGNELGEFKEWDERKSLGWNILSYPMHDAFNQFMRTLNHLTISEPSLYEYDYYQEGFKWLVVDDYQQSVFVYQRESRDGRCLVVVLNFTQNNHDTYLVPVSYLGVYKEILNTNHKKYGGSHVINSRQIKAKKVPSFNEQYSISVKIAPFSGMIFELKK